NLAPMAVLPSHQRKGIGGLLIRDGIEACRKAGCGVIIVRGRRRIGVTMKDGFFDRDEMVYAGKAGRNGQGGGARVQFIPDIPIAYPRGRAQFATAWTRPD